MKPAETLMEARSDSDVQIDRRICVQRHETNRTIYRVYKKKLYSCEISVKLKFSGRL